MSTQTIATVDLSIRNSHDTDMELISVFRNILDANDAWELTDEGQYEEFFPGGVFSAEWKDEDDEQTLSDYVADLESRVEDLPGFSVESDGNYVTVTRTVPSEKDKAIDRLRILFPKGSTVTTIVRHVSASGMSRAIQVVGTDPVDGEIVDATYLLIRAGLGKRFGNHSGIRVNGCGMDMAWKTAYDLATVLYGDGYALINNSL